MNERRRATETQGQRQRAREIGLNKRNDNIQKWNEMKRNISLAQLFFSLPRSQSLFNSIFQYIDCDYTRSITQSIPSLIGVSVDAFFLGKIRFHLIKICLEISKSRRERSWRRNKAIVLSFSVSCAQIQIWLDTYTYTYTHKHTHIGNTRRWVFIDCKKTHGRKIPLKITIILFVQNSILLSLFLFSSFLLPLPSPETSSSSLSSPCHTFIFSFQIL